ncbi:MAG: GNAT family N-acetyltransferase [Spirochaetota bacterium]
MNEDMHKLQILPVRSRNDIKAFIQFPKRLYAGCPQYIPWLDKSMRLILTHKHPFFDHSAGEFFICRNASGLPVGRIALLEPARFNTYTKKNDCRIYFFDVIEDYACAEALFSHAVQWARRRGLDRLIGPQGFSGFTGAGILIKGFEHRASMTMMNYHYRYYHTFFERFGFDKYKDFYSAQKYIQTFELPRQLVNISNRVMKQGTYTVKRIGSKRQLRAEANRIMKLYNEAFVTHEEFCPMTDRELKAAVQELTTVLDPRLVILIEAGGEPAGFLLAFPDLSAPLHKAYGKLGLKDVAALLLEKRRTKRFIINGIGILPKYQSNGLMALLYTQLINTLLERGAQWGEMTQIAETTTTMMKSIEKMQADPYKIHRVYQLSL